MLAPPAGHRTGALRGPCRATGPPAAAPAARPRPGGPPCWAPRPRSLMSWRRAPRSRASAAAPTARLRARPPRATPRPSRPTGTPGHARQSFIITPTAVPPRATPRPSRPTGTTSDMPSRTLSSPRQRALLEQHHVPAARQGRLTICSKTHSVMMLTRLLGAACEHDGQHSIM